MATKTQINTNSVQTLENKTLTAPVVNGGTCGSDPVLPLGIATKQYVDNLLASILPPGTQLPYGGASAPAGFLVCDGSAVSRTAFSLLFAAISTFYGVGDGSSTFNLPDKRGRGSIGAGTGPGLSPRTRGTKLGAETATAPLPLHNHGNGAIAFSAGAQGGSGGQLVTITGTAPAGSGTGVHNNMSPEEVDLWIIKT